MNSATDEKYTFAKDIVSFANAGGTDPKRILIGFEDSGDFYVPSTDQDRADHVSAMAILGDETRLQQTVSSRTLPTPSVRVAHSGTHREGPYVLLEIRRDIVMLPYRVFRSPDDRRSPDALSLGEVWIRKGSTNDQATSLEIEVLERQAALQMSIRAGA